MTKIKDKDPRSVVSMFAGVGIAVSIAFGSLAVLTSGTHVTGSGDPYPTQEELEESTGKRVVVMADPVGNAEFAKNFCWAVGLPATLDVDMGQDVGCDVEVSKDVQSESMSVGEQIETCESDEVNGSVDLITTDMSDPRNAEKVNWVCLVEPTQTAVLEREN